MIADSEIELRAARLLIYQAAWKADLGQDVKVDASIAKLYSTETAFRVLDRCVQMFGALGLSSEAPLERWFRDLRVKRLGEGATEVQRMVVSRAPAQRSMTDGPLNRVRVVELAGMGPGPHAAMLLADLGADVVRVQRPGLLPAAGETPDFQQRNRRIVEADLKATDDVETPCATSSVGPTCSSRGSGPAWPSGSGSARTSVAQANPGLVYARMTGWGQDGPDAARAGHDINYLSWAGRAARDRAGRAGAGAAAQPGRRLRRRLAVPGRRHPGRAARA